MVSSNIMMLPPVSPPRSLSENDRPGDTGPCPGGTTMPRVPIANFSSFLSRSECSCRLALDRPRVVDIEINVVAGKRRAPGCSALCRVKAVPHTLRNDRDHSGAKHEGLRRPVVADNFQGLRTVENVNQLVLRICFPMTRPCGLTGDEDTVAIRAQLRPTAPALRPLCLRCQSTEHGQLGEFGVEIDDARRFAFHFSLHLLT